MRVRQDNPRQETQKNVGRLGDFALTENWRAASRARQGQRRREAAVAKGYKGGFQWGETEVDLLVGLGHPPSDLFVESGELRRLRRLANRRDDVLHGLEHNLVRSFIPQHEMKDHEDDRASRRVGAVRCSWPMPAGGALRRPQEHELSSSAQASVRKDPTETAEPLYPPCIHCCAVPVSGRPHPCQRCGPWSPRGAHALWCVNPHTLHVFCLLQSIAFHIAGL